MERELQREAAKLYALPGAEFTAARNARARAMRSKQPELAAELAKLPRPTAPAAAVNLLARDDPSEVRALAQAGRALRQAQEQALAGKGAADELTHATAEHRAALERVSREARRLKLSQSVLKRVIATLRAASLDPELQPLLERGLLVREVEAAGFGLDPGLVASAPRSKPKPTGASEAQKRRRAEQAARLQEAKARVAEAKRSFGRAERELTEAQAELEAVQAASAASPSRSRSRSRSDT
jgi:hypothetical protein